MKRFLSILTLGFVLAGVTLQVLRVFFKFENIPTLALLICIAIAAAINFLKQKISFIDIFNVILDSFNIPNNEVIDNIDEILYTDELYRSKINKILNKYTF